MPNLEKYLKMIWNLDYPKDKLILYLHNNITKYNEDIEKFLAKYGTSYAKVQFIKAEGIQGWKPSDDLR